MSRPIRTHRRPAGLHWPASMAGQLGLLLLAGALATHGIGILFLLQVGALVHPMAVEQVLERHAVAYASVRGEGAAALAALNAGAQRVWLAGIPEVAPHRMLTEERLLEAALRDRLGLDAATPVWVQLERTDGGPARERLPTLRQWEALQLRLSIGLPDGRWLNSWQYPSGSYEWWRLLRFSLPVSILPVLVIGWLFVRRILRPVRALVEATGRVGRGERIAPLPVAGPREARELTQAFNRMQAQLTRFVQDRTRMLAAIGHDFRTPIASLRLQAALVDDAALRGDMVETLADMRAMVEETLDFARDDAAGEPTQAIDLRALLQTVARRYGGSDDAADADADAPAGAAAVPGVEARAGGEGRVALRVDPSAGGAAAFRGRPVALRRAVANLVDNALRHGGGARIGLSRGLRHADAAWRIDVDDDGPGIPEALHDKVFEPFYCADPARGQGPGAGLGLGLSIARTCVQAHGGEIALENRPGGGLRASIWLPA